MGQRTVASKVGSDSIANDRTELSAPLRGKGTELRRLRRWDVHPHVLTDERELEAVQSALATFHRDRPAEYDRSTESRDYYGEYAGLIAWYAQRGAHVLDLGPGSHMSPYNGEVYNYRMLRRELVARGHSFVSGTDTEVILRGYEEWGRGVLPRLNGIFVFALWDPGSAELTVACDRFGVKPL